MAISYQSKEFQSTLDSISNLETEEERLQLLEERGIDQKDFEDAYLEYEPIKDNVGRKIFEKYNVSSLDELTPEGREEFQIELDDNIQTGFFGSRIVGRAIGDTVRGIVELGDVLADTTKTGQEITDVIAKKADEFSDEYLPESFKEAIGTVFDPYHSNSTAGDIEDMTGQLAGILIPATGLVKGAQLGLKAAATLSPAARATASRMGRQVKNTVGEKVSKVAGQSATAAQYGAGVAVAAPFIGDDINKKLDDVGIDRTGLSKQQKYAEYYKQQVPKDIALESGIAAAIPLGFAVTKLVGAGVGKGTTKLLGEDAIKRVSSTASNNVLSRFVRENFTSQRGVDDITFSAAVKRDNASKAILKATDGLTQDLQRAVKKDKVLGRLSKENRQKALNMALTEGRQLPTSPEVQTIITKMRGNIDNMSKKLGRNTVNHSNLAGVLDKNLGLYVNRSYDLFDNPEFRKEMVKRVKKFKPDDQLVQNAANFIKQKVGNNTSNAKVQEILLAMARATPENKLERELAILSNSLVRGSQSGALKRRKNLPKELKEFYGEIKDPATNYSKTMANLSRYNSEVDFLNEIKDNMIQKGLAKTDKTFIDDADFVNSAAGLDKRLQKVFGNARYKDIKNPLEGLYVDPTYQKLISRGLDDWATPDNKFLQLLLKAKGVTQAAKTVYNPATHTANTIGQATILLANGILPVGKGAGKAVGTTLRSLAGKSNEELGKYQARLSELGVVNSGVGLGMIRRNLQQAGKDPYNWMEVGSKNRAVDLAKKATVKKPFEIYQAEDDVFKIMHFEKTRAYLKKALPDVGEVELDRLAAQRTRDLMPNYAQVSRAIQGLRVSPLGDFLSFPAEMIRISKNLGKYTLQDAMSGNKILQKEAAKKLAGLTTVGMLPSMMSEFSKVSHDVTNDQVDAINTLAPPYETFSDRIYLSGVDKKQSKFNPTGQIGVDYLSFSSLDPFDYLKSAARATHQIINSVDYEDGEINITNRPEFNQAMTGLFENQMAPFVGTSMLTDAFLRFGTGTKSRGEAFTPTSDYVGTKLTDAGVSDSIANAMSIALDPFTPGFMNYLKKKEAFEKSKGRSSGAIINAEEVNMQGLLGLGKKRMDFSAGLNYNLRPFEGILNSNQKFKKEIGDQNSTSQSIYDAYLSTQKDRLKAQEEIQYSMDAYRQLGFDNEAIIKAMGLGKSIMSQPNRLPNILRTEMNQFIPSGLSQSDMATDIGTGQNKIPVEDIRNVYDQLLNSTVTGD